MRFLTLFLLLLVHLSGCKPDSDVVPTQAKLVNRVWLRSHEEESASSSTRVYRLEGYNFPPSWPRTGYLFHEDGRLVHYNPAPNDGGSIPSEVGTWTWEDADIIYGHYSSPYSTGEYKLKVIELTNDMLKVRELP